jgi:hypothetical protein
VSTGSRIPPPAVLGGAPEGDQVHVRISRGSFDPGRFDEVNALVEAVLQTVQSLPGFQRYVGAVDRESGRLVAISYWESSDTANFPREALGGVMSQVQQAGVSLEPAEVYEVQIEG